MDLKLKSQLANQVLQIISKSPNAILKSEWTRKISEKLELRPDVLGNELKKMERPWQIGSKNGMKIWYSANQKLTTMWKTSQIN